MRKILSLFMVLAFVFLSVACSNKKETTLESDISEVYTQTEHTHNFSIATCTVPEKCTVCSKERGTTLGHTFISATCTEPRKCTVCGETKGDALGHSFSEATCTEAQICTICNATGKSALGHKWGEANCGNPKICIVCGGSDGRVVDHIYETVIIKKATCMTEGEKRTKCKKCNHEWTETIECVAHNYSGTRCTVCNGIIPLYEANRLLAEFEGVKIYYLGIENGTNIKLRVENTNQYPVVWLQAHNDKVNGNEYVGLIMSVDLLPNQTKECSMWADGEGMKYYEFDVINTAEFIFEGRKKIADSSYDVIKSEKIILNPYE